MPRWYSWCSVSIIRRIIDRFNLQETPQEPAEAWIIPKVVQPITDIDELLRSAKLGVAVRDLNVDASIYVVFFTVPTGKRWTLLHIAWSPSTGSSLTRIQDSDGNNIDLCDMSSTGDFMFTSSRPILEQGWTIRRRGTANLADTVRAVKIWYLEEDAF